MYYPVTILNAHSNSSHFKIASEFYRDSGYFRETVNGNAFKHLKMSLQKNVK